jgi:GNAT superfamily N-acetyltransferase
MVEITEYNGENITPLAKAWVSECSLGEFDLPTAVNDIVAMHEGRNSEVFILKYNGRIVGGLGIGILDMFFTKDSWSAVRYWYIEPDYRFLARQLINRAEKWSLDKGCTKIMVCSNRMCHPGENAPDEFYLKMGFRQFETVYVGDLRLKGDL